MAASGRTIGIIPARGGSKGIPKKNIHPIGGKPLLWWTIDQCRRTPEIEEVFVSTDDAAIAQVARASGATVIDRPAELSGDASSSEAALLHALDVIERRGAGPVELVAFLQATSPLRQPEDVSRAIALMRASGADSLFSCHLVEDICLWEKRPGGYEPITYDYRHRKPRQQEMKRYLENGSFYLVRAEYLKRTGCRLGGKIEVYVMDSWKGLQIDSPDDLVMAESFLGRIRPALART